MVMGSSTVVVWGNSLLIRLCLRAVGTPVGKLRTLSANAAARLGSYGRERTVPARRAGVYHPRCAGSGSMAGLLRRFASRSLHL